MIIRLAEHTKAGLAEGKKDMKKSGVRAYACELLLLTARLSDRLDYLANFSSQLLALGKQDETSKLHELISWCLEGVDFRRDVPALCQQVKSCMDKVSPMSHELVQSVRALSEALTSAAEGGEERRRTLLISLHANDLTENYLHILTKVCGYHEQPHLHTATFMGYNGYILLSVVQPVVWTLKLAYETLIDCQEQDFRDVSMVGVLLRTFTLCSVVPSSSPSYDLSRRVCRDVAAVLISLTSTSTGLSAAAAGAGTGDDLENSVWHKMLKELLTFTSSAPHAFVPGLRILAELLPLPLPIDCETPLTEEEQERAESVRSLWSAHIFASGSQVSDIIQNFGCCSLPSLSQLLRQVCIHLADLSPPIATLVVRSGHYSSFLSVCLYR